MRRRAYCCRIKRCVLQWNPASLNCGPLWAVQMSGIMIIRVSGVDVKLTGLSLQWQQTGVLHPACTWRRMPKRRRPVTVIQKTSLPFGKNPLFSEHYAVPEKESGNARTAVSNAVACIARPGKRIPYVRCTMRCDKIPSGKEGVII